MPAGSPDERCLDRLHPLLPVSKGFGRELLNGIAHVNRSGRSGHGKAKAHRYWIQNPPGNLPEETSALKTEDAAPQAIQIDGDNRRIDALHDLLEATLEWQQLPGTRHLAFGKDANQFPACDRVL